MQTKICFLFVVLLTIVARSTSVDVYSRRGSSALDRTSSYNDDTDKDDTSDDDHSQQSTPRRNRYSPYGSTSSNYRSRSRGPSYDDSYDSDDRPRQGYGMGGRSSNYPGSLSPQGLEGSSYRSNGPNCYSLLDPVYPLFSDICGAVPQARYSLPNSFGHFDRWQIAQVLTVILGPTGSASLPCTRSLRLLLCPLLFPPCQTRYEAPPVLPCQPFCQVVKNQCASPALDILPCEFLPPTSDLCPINPTPFGPLTSPFASPLSLNGPFSPVGLPQSALQSILAQSALSPFDISSSPFSPLFQSSPYSSGFPLSDISSPYSSGFPPSAGPSSPYSSPQYSSGGPSSPYSSPQYSSGGPSSPYSPSQYSSGGPSSPFSSFSSSSRVSPSAFSQLLSSAGISPSMLTSLGSPSGFGASPFSQLLNSESYMGDISNLVPVDFSPMSYGQDYRRGSPRYFPTPRSATERV